MFFKNIVIPEDKQCFFMFLPLILPFSFCRHLQIYMQLFSFYSKDWNLPCVPLDAVSQ